MSRLVLVTKHGEGICTISVPDGKRLREIVLPKGLLDWATVYDVPPPVDSWPGMVELKEKIDKLEGLTENFELLTASLQKTIANQFDIINKLEEELQRSRMNDPLYDELVALRNTYKPIVNILLLRI